MLVTPYWLVRGTCQPRGDPTLGGEGEGKGGL